VDGVENHLDLTENFVVPEAEYLVALRHEPAGARLVRLSLAGISVLGTVDFDHELGPVADEVGDVRPNRHLSPEMPSRNGHSATMRPEALLRRRQCAAQSRRSFGSGFRRARHLLP
jgi:hypothetical protein